MNDQKQKRIPAIVIVLLAAAAGVIGLLLSKMDLSPAVPVPANVALQGYGSKDFKDLAKGRLAAFLVKAERLPMPDLKFRNAEGTELSLNQWKGRVALLNLWATWCAPCRKEMPTLAALQKQLGSRDFEVVALSVDRKGVAASSAFLKETGADSLGLYVDDTAKALDVLQGIGLPLTILVDRRGREIGRLLGPAEWDSDEAVALIKAAIAEAP